MPVESMDFGLLTGDVVPRDGLQRPLLTSGSPTHAPVPRRASKQPINVTHVHQTVVQNFGPVATACPTTVAESTSGLSCLEAALHVPRGSVYAPASRWKHRNKWQVAAGVAPHAHEGAMAHGTSMGWVPFCYPKGTFVITIHGILRILCALLENTGILTVFCGILTLLAEFGAFAQNLLVFLCILVRS
jgi:hypothetical protein